MDQYLEMRLSHKKIAPTYTYLFSHKGSASFTEIFKGGKENYWGENLKILIDNTMIFFIVISVFFQRCKPCGGIAIFIPDC